MASLYSMLFVMLIETTFNLSNVCCVGGKNVQQKVSSTTKSRSLAAPKFIQKAIFFCLSLNAIFFCFKFKWYLNDFITNIQNYFLCTIFALNVYKFEATINLNNVFNFFICRHFVKPDVPRPVSFTCLILKSCGVFWLILYEQHLWWC